MQTHGSFSGPARIGTLTRLIRPPANTENLDRYTELRSHADLQTRLVMRKGVLNRERACGKASIEDVRCHNLRHSVASQAVAFPTVARMLGHADPTTTLRYAHVSDGDAEIAAERIGRLIVSTMETGEAIVG